MRVVVVDPVSRRVSERDILGDLASLQSVVGGYIELIPLQGLAPGLAYHHGYLDEEGRLKPETARYRFHLRGWPEMDLCGPMVIMRGGEDGSDLPATVQPGEVEALITWL